MRKMMTKEVTFTTLKLTKVEVKEGKPELVTLPDETILGTISPEKAQKFVNKKHNSVVFIVAHDVEDVTFEMPVEEFIKVATRINSKSEDTETTETTETPSETETETPSNETQSQTSTETQSEPPTETPSNETPSEPSNETQIEEAKKGKNKKTA